MANNVKINESRDELADEIERLETNSSAAIRPTLPKVTLQEKSYDAPDDGTLKKSAESELPNTVPRAKKAFGKIARRRKPSLIPSATYTPAPKAARRRSLNKGTRQRLAP